MTNTELFDTPRFTADRFNNQYSGFTPNVVAGDDVGDMTDPWADTQRVINSASNASFNADILTQLSPNFWNNNEDLLVHMSNQNLTPFQLSQGLAVIEQYTTTDQVRTALENMDASKQRAAFDQLSLSEQEALMASGYDIDEIDLNSKNWFIRGLSKGASFVGGVPILGDTLKFVGGNTLKGLEYGSELPLRAFRTIRQLDSWKQITYLGLGLATGVAAVLATPVTFGASLAGLGASASFFALATVAGATTAAAVGETAIASVTGNENQFLEAWAKAKDGEKLFKPSAIAEAKNALNHPSLYGLAEAVALDVDPYDVAAFFAGVRNSTDHITQIEQLGEFASQYAEPGTPEYYEITAAVERLRDTEAFQTALTKLQQGKYSPGRFLAGTILRQDPNSRFYKIASTLGDGAWRWFVDPANLIAPAVSYARFARLGVQVEKTVNVARFTHVAQTNRLVRRAHNDFAKAVEANRFTDVVPNLREAWTPFRNWAQAKGLLDTNFNALQPLDNSHVVEYFTSEVGKELVQRGVGLKRGAHQMLMFAPQRNAGVRAALRNNLLEFRNSFTDPNALRKINQLLQENGMDELATFEPQALEDLLLDGRLVEIGEESTTGLVGVPGRVIGRSFAWVNNSTGGTLGRLMDSLSIMAPRETIDLVSGAGIDRAVNAMSSVMGLPKSFAAKWLNTVMATGDVGERARLMRAFYDTIFDMTGFSASKDGRRLVQEWGTMLQAYGLGGLDAARAGSKIRNTVPRGLLLIDQALEMPIPDLREIITAQRLAAVGDLSDLFTKFSVMQQAGMKYWRPLVLFRGAYIPRNAGEEMLAWFGRMGNLEVVAQLGARRIGKYNRYLEVRKKVDQAKALGKQIILSAEEQQVLNTFQRGFVNNAVHKSEAIGGSVVGSALDAMEAHVRRVFEFGFGQLESRSRRFGDRFPKFADRFKNPLTETLVAGRKNSWRRIAVRGVQNELIEYAHLYVNRNARAMMEAVSSNNRSLYASELTQPVQGLRQVGPTGEIEMAPVVAPSNEFERIGFGDPAFAFAKHDEAHRVLTRNPTTRNVLSSVAPRTLLTDPNWDYNLWVDVIEMVNPNTPLANEFFTKMNYLRPDMFRARIAQFRELGESQHVVYEALADVLDDWLRKVESGIPVTGLDDLDPVLVKAYRDATIDATNRKINGKPWLDEEFQLDRNMAKTHELSARLANNTPFYTLRHHRFAVVAHAAQDTAMRNGGVQYAPDYLAQLRRGQFSPDLRNDINFWDLKVDASNQVVYRGVPGVRGVEIESGHMEVIYVDGNGNLHLTPQTQDHTNPDLYKAISTSLSKTHTYGYINRPVRYATPPIKNDVQTSWVAGDIDGLVYEIDFNALVAATGVDTSFNKIIYDSPASYGFTGDTTKYDGSKPLAVRYDGGGNIQHEVAFILPKDVISVVIPAGKWRTLPESQMTLGSEWAAQAWEGHLRNARGVVNRLLIDEPMQFKTFPPPYQNTKVPDWVTPSFGGTKDEQITFILGSLRNRLDLIGQRFHKSQVPAWTTNYISEIEKLNPDLARFVETMTAENFGVMYRNVPDGEPIQDYIFNQLFDAMDSVFGDTLALRLRPNRVGFEKPPTLELWDKDPDNLHILTLAELKPTLRKEFDAFYTTALRESMSLGAGDPDRLVPIEDANLFASFISSVRHPEFDYFYDLFMNPEMQKIFDVVDAMDIEDYTSAQQVMDIIFEGTDEEVMALSVWMHIMTGDYDTNVVTANGKMQSVLGWQATPLEEDVFTQMPSINTDVMATSLVAQYGYGHLFNTARWNRGFLDPTSTDRFQRGLAPTAVLDSGPLHSSFDEALENEMIYRLWSEYNQGHAQDLANQSEFMVETQAGHTVQGHYNPYQKELFTVEITEPKYLASTWVATQQLYPNSVDHFEEIVDDVVTRLMTNEQGHIATTARGDDIALTSQNILETATAEDLRDVLTQYVRTVFTQMTPEELFRMPANWFIPNIGISDPRTAMWLQGVLNRSGNTPDNMASLYSTVVPRWAGVNTNVEVPFNGNVLTANQSNSVGQTFTFTDANPDIWTSVSGPISVTPDGKPVIGVSRQQAIYEYAQQGLERVKQVLLPQSPPTYAVRDGAQVFTRNAVTGELEEVVQQAGGTPRVFKFGDQVFDADGAPLDLADPKYFAEELETVGGDLQWEFLAGYFLDNFDDLSNNSVIASVGARDMAAGEVFASTDSDLTRLTYSRVDDVNTIPADDLRGTVAIGPRLAVVPTNKNIFERIVTDTFSKVFGPAIDALSRQPQAMHAFVTALPTNLSIAEWSFDQRLADVMMRHIKLGGTPETATAMQYLDDAYGYLTYSDVFIANRIFDGLPDYVFDSMIEGKISAEDLTQLLQRYSPPKTTAVGKLLSDPDFGIQGTLEDMRELGRSAKSARANILKAEENTQIQAINSIIPYIDDSKERSLFATKVQTLMPFHYAEENFIKRWARIFGESDDLLLRKIHQAQLTFNGMREAGIVTEDPNGDWWVAMPGAGLVHSALSTFFNLGGIGLDTANIDLKPVARLDNLLPGFNTRVGEPQIGPLGALPMSILSAWMPELQPIRRDLLGDLGATRKWWETFIPPVLARGKDALHAMFDPEYMSVAMGSALNNYTAYTMADGSFPGETASAKEREEWLNKARNLARISFLSNFIVNTIFPVPGTTTFKVAGQPDDGGITTALTQVDIKDVFTQDFQTYVKTFGYDEGLYQYINNNPNANVYQIFNPQAFQVAGTDRLTTGPILATEEAYEFYVNHNDFMTEHPNGLSWFAPGQGFANDTETSAYVWNQLMYNGLRQRITNEEFNDALIYKVSSYEYYDMLERHERELLSVADKPQTLYATKQRHDAEISDWKLAHPLFDQLLQNANGRTQRQTTINDIRTIINSDAVESPYFDAIGDLHRAYEVYTISRSRITGQSSAEIQKRNAFDREFQRFGEEWALMNPDIEMLWKSVYEPESGIR